MSPERAQSIVDAFDAEFASTATSVVPPDGLIEYISPFEGRQVFGVETGVRYFSPTCTHRGHWGLTERWIRWLLTCVSAEVHCGGDTDLMSEGPLVDEDLLARCRAAWDALPASDRT